MLADRSQRTASRELDSCPPYRKCLRQGAKRIYYVAEKGLRGAATQRTSGYTHVLHTTVGHPTAQQTGTVHRACEERAKSAQHRLTTARFYSFESLSAAISTWQHAALRLHISRARAFEPSDVTSVALLQKATTVGTRRCAAHLFGEKNPRRAHDDDNKYPHCWSQHRPCMHKFDKHSPPVVHMSPFGSCAVRRITIVD